MKILRTYRRSIVLSSLFFVAMIAAPSSSFAQGCTNRISGRVTLDGSTPERRVDVHLLLEQGRDRTVRTDNDGYYSFAKVCPGSYRVRPGPAFLENAMQPSRYTPSSQEVTIPSGNKIQTGNGPVSVKHIDFMRASPPGQGGPSGVGNFIADKIRIDESVRSGQDLKLAREIEQFFENTLPCKEHLCDLTISVRNSRVALAGVMQPNDKPLLKKVGEAIGGIRRLDISGVKFKEQP